MRKKIVAANWKMNLTLDEGKSLVDGILAGAPAVSNDRQVVIAPPYTHLPQVVTQLTGKSFFSAGAQNCYSEPAGAYTGEISAAMLNSVGTAYVIIGHSERRMYFGEDDALLSRKTDQALANGLNVIFCCGEPLEVRDAGTEKVHVETQIKAGLFHLDAMQLQHIVIAYEPVWAIGTGRTATAEQAQEMHAHIRGVVAAQYDHEAAGSLSILYGGSCKPSNAPELFACPDVDGGLIGGASLKADEFLGIIDAMLKA